MFLYRGLYLHKLKKSRFLTLCMTIDVIKKDWKLQSAEESRHKWQQLHSQPMAE